MHLINGMVGSYFFLFLSQSDKLCLLIEVASSFTFNVLTYMVSISLTPYYFLLIPSLLCSLPILLPLLLLD